MRLLILPLLGLTILTAGLTAGCDRQSAPVPQGKEAEKVQAPPPPAPPPVVPGPPAAPAKPAAETDEIIGVLDVSHKGAAMPKDAFEGPDGKPTTLAAFKGKPLLVNLWATWCVPCLAEMPALDTLAAREAGRLQIVAISQDSKGRPAVAAWWNAQGFKALQPSVDKDMNMSFAYEGAALPTTILYGADGKEIWRVAGATDWDGEGAKKLLAEAL